MHATPDLEDVRAAYLAADHLATAMYHLDAPLTDREVHSLWMGIAVESGPLASELHATIEGYLIDPESGTA